MKEMKMLTLNGTTYEIVDEKARARLNETDAMLIATETGLINPVVTASGHILTDKDGIVITM